MFFAKTSAFELLVVGLGNPGLTYKDTRHNAGFTAVDRLAEKADCTMGRERFDAIYGDCMIEGRRVLLAKPQTYMNNSGRAVTALCRFYKIPYDRVIVLFDDISLDVGRIRIRRRGSHGGHNGMKDIIELAGTEDITRIKIGVGAKPRPDYDLKDWVLGKFPAEVRPDFERAVDRAADAVAEIAAHGVDAAMNLFNG